MAWWDFFKLWDIATKPDSLSALDQNQDLPGAGVIQPDAIPDIRQDGSMWGGGGRGTIRLRDTNDFVDLSSTTSRVSRYKEYERLRNVAEIEMAMTVIADESCLGPHTAVATLFNGYRSIEWLTQTYKGEPFLVYSWDFKNHDYTLGWAYDPRVVRKNAETVRVILDDGTSMVVTPDHRILRRDESWARAGDLKRGDELMPFYRLEPNRLLNKLKVGQYPRIYTHNQGWIHQKQFIDQWKFGETPEKYNEVNRACRLIANGVSSRKISPMMGHQWKSISDWIQKEGFTADEVSWLGKKRESRRVVSVLNHVKTTVYDLSVKDHENFCIESGVVHNCQRGENNHVFQIECGNKEIMKELEFLLFHRKMLNMDRRVWNLAKKLCIFGDYFAELIINPDNPKDGILKMQELPCESVYRIETTRGKVVEYQQSKEGPDYQSLTRAEVTTATEQDLMQSTAIRFSPKQIVHWRIGDDRKTFFPYGQSLIEPARGPAHQLRLMEDAMVVYRLTRAPERRVFYIDTGNLAPGRAEAYVDRLKDHFRKKKVAMGSSQAGPAAGVEERWHVPAMDEDYWFPIKGQSNSRIDTLPGAQNLGEIDDALYFRNKLFTALNFPKNYFNSEDPNATRITLSAQDVKFARMIERIQSHIVDGFMEICERHLELRGYPEEQFEDLKLSMTPPSDWREMSRSEVLNQRLALLTGLKTSLMMADYDLLTKYWKLSETDAEEVIARNKIQKFEDAKLQVLIQNPQLLGIGVPGSDETEMGAEPTGPNPMLGGPEGEAPPPPEGGDAAGPPPDMGDAGGPAPNGDKPKGDKPNGGMSLEEPSEDDIKKYDLGIQSYDQEQDREEISR